MTSSSSITEMLLSVLANSYSLCLKTQNYHWNITGPHFIELHKLLDDQYSELIEAVDGIAEHIRTYGIKIQADFGFFQGLNQLAEADHNADYKTMIMHLLEDNKKLYQIIVDCIKVAEDNSNYTTVDLLSNRLLAHEKNIWVLDSILA